LGILLILIDFHMNRRIYYLDLLRVFLTMLVFFHHSAIGFGASGGWYYLSKETTTGVTQILLSLLMGIDQSYFMSLFFFISALLMPESLDRKGFRLFLVDRVKRLLVPLLIFVFILNPLLVYWIYGHWNNFGPGPMWFVFTLLIFESSYLAYRKWFKKRIVINWKRPSVLGIITFFILAGIFAFSVRLFCPTGKNILGLQLGYFPLYIFMYALGIIAGRNGWLERIQVRDSLPWFLIAIFLGIPFFAESVLYYQNSAGNFAGGWSVQALIYAFWEPVMCAGFSYFLVAIAKKYFDKPCHIMQTLSADSYAFYIIHPFFVVGFTFLSETLPIVPLVRLFFVLLVGIPVCFGAAHGLRLVFGKHWL